MPICINRAHWCVGTYKIYIDMDQITNKSSTHPHQREDFCSYKKYINLITEYSVQYPDDFVSFAAPVAKWTVCNHLCYFVVYKQAAKGMGMGVGVGPCPLTTQRSNVWKGSFAIFKIGRTQHKKKLEHFDVTLISLDTGFLEPWRTNGCYKFDGG